MNTNLLEMFGLEQETFSAVITDSELFEGTRTTTMLRTGKRTPYDASINGVRVPAYVTLQEAALTRLSLLEQTQTGRTNSDGSAYTYNLVTGIFKPVKMDVELVIDGETMNLIEFLRRVASQAAGQDISYEKFLHSASRIGLNFEQGMPLFFQQFGANEEGYNAIVQLMRHVGATDTAQNMVNRGRIVSAWQMPDNTSIPVTAFELGTVDRTQSARYRHDGVGQGFLNLADAQLEQFQRIVGLRKSAKVLGAQQTAGNLTQDQIQKLDARKKVLTDMSRQWTSNWAGAQKRLVTQQNGTFVEHDQYDPVNAPCGRFTVVHNDSEFEIDLWKNSNRGSTTANVPNMTAANAEVGEDEPF